MALFMQPGQRETRSIVPLRGSLFLVSCFEIPVFVVQPQLERLTKDHSLSGLQKNVCPEHSLSINKGLVFRGSLLYACLRPRVTNLKIVVTTTIHLELGQQQLQPSNLFPHRVFTIYTGFCRCSPQVRMLSLLLFLSFTTHLTRSLAVYSLIKSYTSQNFYQEFDFFTGSDPTNGHVQYVDLQTAGALGLAGTTSWHNFSNLIYLGADNKNPAPNGRPSTRVSSKATFNHGLFITDIVHSPSGICGTWPALWMLGTGADWPFAGEIDIMENVNTASSTQLTLHTSEGCQMPPTTPPLHSGHPLDADCNCVNGNNGNAGCGIRSTDHLTYGNSFNSQSGGLYAVQWTAVFIKIWFFPRSLSSTWPSDLSSTNPDPSTWPTPQAYFPGGSNCDIGARFRNMQIIINLTFCGDWAGHDWAGNAECAAKAKTCEEFVSQNPREFVDAFWALNEIQVFEEGGQAYYTDA